MECGGDDAFCQLATWLSHNEFIASFIVERLSSLGATTTTVLKSLFEFIRDHSQSFFGAFGVTFGAWRWWKYREVILHERLKAYISESDARLTQSEQDLMNALRRPGQIYPVNLPLFSNNELRSVLRERNWDKTPYALTIEKSADAQLRMAIEKLERQLASAKQCLLSLNHQLSTAHLLRGAIASNSAKVGRDARDQVNALDEFRTALQLNDRSIFAKELEALELWRSGQDQLAKKAFQDLEMLAAQITDERDRLIIISRAKRYQAEIAQLQNSTVDADGTRTFTGSLTAYNLLSQFIPGSALALRNSQRPFMGWDLLEHGDMFYIAALVSHHLNFLGMRNQHLQGAHDAYSAVLAQRSLTGVLPGRRYRQLLKLAREGLRRVQDAQRTESFESL